MKKINIIGAGKVGKTLGFLFHQHKIYDVQNVLNRSVESATEACKFINSGTAVSHYADLTPADIFLIAVADEEIKNVMDQLTAQQILRADDIVFHTSGALASDVLDCKNRQIHIASVHPVKSCGNPVRDVTEFSGIYCALEGDDEALQELSISFSKIGANCLTIAAEDKILYHAAIVYACNYLTVLFESCFRIFEKIGVERNNAKDLLRPLITALLARTLEKDAKNILTGPVARGDFFIVEKEYEAIKQIFPTKGETYKALADLAKELFR